MFLLYPTIDFLCYTAILWSRQRRKEVVARVIAVCTSEKKGTRKKAVSAGILRDNYSLVGDVQAGCCTHHPAGECVIPTEEIFAKVIRSGVVKSEDSIKVEM